MKNMIVPLTLAVAALVVSFASPSKAQTVGDDGIAASPRIRLMLNDRKAAARASQDSVFKDASYRAVHDDGIAPSPRMRAILNEHQVAVARAIASGTGGSTRLGY